MRMIRWSPEPFATMRNFGTVHDEINRLFDGAIARAVPDGDQSAVFTPSVDIEETPEAFVVRADLPGVAQKDVKVSVLGDTLTIRGERRQATAAGNGSHHRLERLHGAFERSFSLGAAVRNDQVRAQVRDGVLEIHVPKAEEARMREIEVQVG